MLRVIFSLVVSIACFIFSVLINNFYTDYKTALSPRGDKVFVFSVPASSGRVRKFENTFAQLSVSEGKSETIENPLYSRAYYQYIYEFCDPGGGCRKPFVAPKVEKFVQLTTPPVTLDDGITAARQYLHHTPLRTGFVPSDSLLTDGKITQNALAKAFWIGFILPLLLAFVGSSLLIYSVTVFIGHYRNRAQKDHTLA